MSSDAASAGTAVPQALSRRFVLPWRQREMAKLSPMQLNSIGGTTIVVGSQTLQACTLVISGYCGHIEVPINWLAPNEGTISVGFQWVPASGPVANATIVAEEGGPGYATTGTGYAYAHLFAPLLGDHNLLMMDQRGTGISRPIDCKPLQPWAGSGEPTGFFAAVEACGDQLNSNFPEPDGTDLQTSDLFGTNQSVRDLAAILNALQTGPVDFYGDSYGSFFGQVFAARYPQMLRAVVLDSTYPVINQDPFDSEGQVEIRFAFKAVCERSLACAPVEDQPLVEIARLAEALDRSPLVTTTYTPIGQRVQVHVAGSDIETLLSYAGDDEGPYRNLDAAAHAYLDRGDGVPLARLFEWTAIGPAFTYYPYAEFSEGMYMADICTVYTQPYNVFAPRNVREAQYDAEVAALPSWWGYPISNHDVVTSAGEYYDNCLPWPAPVHNEPLVLNQPPLVPATLPVLIVSGDIDETTSPGDARQAANALGSSVQFASFPNEIHVPALGDPFNCASAVVRAFVQTPGPPDTSCGASIPEVRTLGAFPFTVGQEPAASPSAGNGATTTELQLAAVAVEAMGDAIQGARYAWLGFSPNCSSGYCGPGLRGGTFAANASLTSITLTGYAFTSDSTVSGKATVLNGYGPTDPGVVTAWGIVATANNGATTLNLNFKYDQRLPHALVSIYGSASSGHHIVATMPAP